MKKIVLLITTILSFNCLLASEILEVIDPKINDTTLTIKSVNLYKGKALTNNPLFNITYSPIMVINRGFIDLNTNNNSINSLKNYPVSRALNTKEDYIGMVQINDLYNNTYNKTFTGYSDFSSLVASVSKGTSPTISIVRHTKDKTVNKSIRVWIDFNQDGYFNDKSETVLLNDNAALLSKVQLTIPNDAKLGKTKMRISLKHGNLPKSTETFTYGEVEDYTINIKDYKPSTKSLNNLEVYQDKKSQKVIVKFGKTLSNFNVSIYDISGRTIYNSSNKNVTTNTFYINNLNKVSNGTYIIKIEDLENNEIITKKLIK